MASYGLASSGMAGAVKHKQKRKDAMQNPVIVKHGARARLAPLYLCSSATASLLHQPRRDTWRLVIVNNPRAIGCGNVHATHALGGPRGSY